MRISRIVISITLPIFLIMLFASLLTTTPYLNFSKGRYPSHEDVYFDHDYAVDRIIGYLNYRYDNLEFGVNEEDDSIIMRDTEISHMVDVKNLYTGLRVAALISLVIGVSLSYLMFKKDREQLYKTFKTLYLGPVVFIVVVGGAIVFDFDTTFTIFHKIFFTNDDWLLYADDVLILLLPQNFWMISGLIILLLFALSLGLIHFLNEKFNKQEIA